MILLIQIIFGNLFQHNHLYLDGSVPFGFRLGSGFFERCSDAIRYIMKRHGHNALLNYIDDLIYIGLPSKIHESYTFLLSLLQDLGLQVSQKKLIPPSTEVVCLGILIRLWGEFWVITLYN